ncbi:hypothetical protein NECAME_16061 [Necator americanus]|uniref:Uncharacterized protein n=1 Tax=Necator americanus TaxID=51031 RepID=W2TYG7_NECAM|nr:hypothetical protein NECAME_16061 [Necator americanus]ETN86888.1 hypothetical protein NECAME_16061 [Necator americanus]
MEYSGIYRCTYNHMSGTLFKDMAVVLLLTVYFSPLQMQKDCRNFIAVLTTTVPKRVHTIKQCKQYPKRKDMGDCPPHFGKVSVINPNHCIEEWIDERVSIIFYERFFNLEFAAGNYIVKNTLFGNNFLRKWSEYEFKQPTSFTGYDQGGLMILLLKLLIPEAVREQKICHRYWKKASNYSTYMAFVIWSDEDFMFHGWKVNNNLTWVTVFESKIDLNLCGKDISSWKWHQEIKITSAEMRSELLYKEKFYLSQFPREGRVNPLLDGLSIV